MIDLLGETKHMLQTAHAASGLSRTKFMRSVAARSDVGFEWLMKFAAGRIPDPGVVRLQRLHAYLKRMDR